MEKLNIPPLSIEHEAGQVTIRHESGMKTTIGASRLSKWALSLLRKELQLKPELTDEQVKAVDSQMGKL